MELEELNRKRFRQLFPSVSEEVNNEQELDQRMDEYIEMGMFLAVEPADDRREQ